MKLFWDIDETLISSRNYIHDKHKHTFIVDVYDELYYTCVRPCAKQVIEYSRKVFGADNVYILTAAAELYAQRINIQAKWAFPESHIIGRETIESYSIKIPSLYGNETLVAQHPLANKNNLLIDNLFPSFNVEKTSLMLINPLKNYLEVDDYHGYNIDDDIFRDTVIHFMNEAVNQKQQNNKTTKQQNNKTMTGTYNKEIEKSNLKAETGNLYDIISYLHDGVQFNAELVSVLMKRTSAIRLENTDVIRDVDPAAPTQLSEIEIKIFELNESINRTNQALMYIANTLRI